MKFSIRSRFRLLVLSLFIGWQAGSPAADERSSHAVSWKSAIDTAAPTVYWDFTDSDYHSTTGGLSPSAVKGQPTVGHGPEDPDFPLFGSQNASLELDGRSWIVFPDDNDHGNLDFRSGEMISIEAWVRLSSIAEGQQVYVIGKGRTGNPGQARDNHNWALRIRGIGGMGTASFLFRSASQPAVSADENRPAKEPVTGEFHRWNSDLGFEPDGEWHHVAVSFEFGGAAAPVAWIDGRRTGGTWDMGGKTFQQAPVVDNDEVWIGSSMGGAASASFRGGIDELCVYRRMLTDDEIARRYRTTRKTPEIPELASNELPRNTVVLDIREAVKQDDPWNREGTRLTMQWQQPAAAIAVVPRKYSSGAVITDRTNPCIVRMRTWIHTDDTRQTNVLIRARTSSRLLVDDTPVAQIHATSYASDGHQEVPEPPEPLYATMHPVPAGDQEVVVPLELSPGDHLFEFEAVVGGRNMRLESGETLVALGDRESGFDLLSPGLVKVGMDERSWRTYTAQHAQLIRRVEQSERVATDSRTADYWQRRHALARQLAGISDDPETHPEITPELIDQALASVWKEQTIEPMALVDDSTFLRRLALSTVGVIPTPAEIRWFESLPAASRRSQAIDRFLSDDRWADHWVSYWQDVLAENPGILKPELNNSGPFRWWIHDSFLDNKPSDRFASELVMMKGSRLGGAPAGFAMATQNDVPLAERALVLSTAFNARQMKCARCHDSPVRPFTQRELFQVAAMINRGPLSVPPTSSVPLGPDGTRSSLITVSIEPGTVIDPEWPFARNHSERSDQSAWNGLLQNPEDLREQAALHLTHPLSSPFAEVMANRMWAQLFGRGLLDDADDWNTSDSPFHELLTSLGRYHIQTDYDFRKLARLILHTQAWQRQAAPADSLIAQLFAGQTTRRLTAEQMVDSLYVAVGKSFDAEMLTLDPEGRRPESTFLNLGKPTRAWHFCSMSNERDRPALALPVSQSIIDLLLVFGWRDSRPHPITEREEESTVLQPLTLANGNAGHRLVQLSDGGRITEYCVEAPTAEQLVEQMFLSVLSRRPDTAELGDFTAELQRTFASRIVPGVEPQAQPVIIRNSVSWSNHLNAEATRQKQLQEEAARLGDPPTERLAVDWRLAAEDLLWVLLNSPDFAFMP
ncbi:MAG: DUF1553 domain-containing protein [Planctomycetaceae bacterium]|nr:DUF1553 domain-containing protein [Planctomycetaceae bacterium]